MNLCRKFVAAIVFLSLISTVLVAQGNGTIEPYSAQAVALKSKTTTDVTLTFSTTNAVKYPVPAALKKLQIKIRNQAGDVAYLHNAKTLNLTGRVYKTSIVGPEAHNTLEYQAHIKTASSKDEEIVKGTVVTKLYPDLAIESFNAPAEKQVNAPFSVEVYLNEKNLQTSSTCTVSLFKEGTLVAAYPNVSVSAGGNASVVFQGLTHNAAGIQNYSVVVDQVLPGEYDISNNSKSFSIKFISATQVNTTEYNSLYSRNINFKSNRSLHVVATNNLVFEESRTGDEEYFQYEIYKYSDTPLAIDSFKKLSLSLKILTAGNQSFTRSWTDLFAGAVSDGFGGYYYENPPYGYGYLYSDSEYGSIIQASDYDPSTGLYYDIYLDSYSLRSVVSKYRSNTVYIYRRGDQSYTRYETNDPINTFFTETNSLAASLVLTYGDQSWGGGATLNLQYTPNYFLENSYTYFDYVFGQVRAYNSFTASRVIGTSWGITDPNVLPKRGTQGKSIVQEQSHLPEIFSLEQNYPNPFNPSTSIQFALPEASDVTLKVFSMTGQEVAELVRGQFGAGYHTVRFDAKGFSSGTYIYRLQTGNRVLTNKMLLLK